MLHLLKHTYLLDNAMIERDLERLWKRYQYFINKKDLAWDDANEARAILYFIGYLYPEKIALESLQARVKLVRPKIKFDDFLQVIDGKNKTVLNKYKKNIKFKKLKRFYLLVKGIKNRVGQDGSYLDEATFNRIYRKLMPKIYY